MKWKEIQTDPPYQKKRYKLTWTFIWLTNRSVHRICQSGDSLPTISKHLYFTIAHSGGAAELFSFSEFFMKVLSFMLPPYLGDLFFFTKSNNRFIWKASDLPFHAQFCYLPASRAYNMISVLIELFYCSSSQILFKITRYENPRNNNQHYVCTIVHYWEYLLYSGVLPRNVAHDS